MRWDLSDLYPLTSAANLWERDFAALGPGDAEARDVLWAYAYCRYAADVREDEWKERFERVEAANTADAGDEDEDGAEPYVMPRHDAMRAALQSARIDGLTLFQASTAANHRLRADAYALTRREIEKDADGLAAELSELVARRPWDVRPDYAASRAAVLAVAETLRRGVKDGAAWYDLAAAGPSVMDSWDAATTLREAEALYASLLPEWGDTVARLRTSRRLDIAASPYKLPGAFSLPLPGGRLPLSYVHDVRGREAALGLVHELAHGVHFAAYRDGADGGSLPAPSVLELFPMTIELVATRRWEGPAAQAQKVMTSTLLQLAYVEMRLALQVERPTGFAGMQELWEELCRRIFGPRLEIRRGENLAWLANRYLWSPSGEPQSYVVGGFAAWVTADHLVEEGRDACAILHDLLRRGTEDWLAELECALKSRPISSPRLG